MKHCANCKMDVRGSRKTCPLCQGALTGEDEPEIFPTIPTFFKQYMLFFKLLAFSTISVGIISVMVNVILPDHGWWSFFVVLGLACFWIMLAFAVRKRNNIAKIIMYQTVLVVIFSIIWDNITGWRGWSVDFVLPIAFIVGMAGIYVTSLILRVPIEDYLLYLIIDLLFSLIPAITLATNMVRLTLPSYICLTISIITIAAVVIFAGRKLLDEVQKRFHV